MDEYTNIDEYIAQFPDETRTILEKIRATIHEAALGAEETIRYGIPTLRQNCANLVHFVAFRNHISFFPTSSGIANFSRDLSQYKTSRGTVQFPSVIPVPFELIARIVRFRVAEITGMKTGKKPGAAKSER